MIIFEDLKYAIRLLSKKPGFTALTVLVMAVGLGLSIYLFSYMNTQIFKDLPFKDSGTLVQIYSSQDGVRNSGTIDLHDYYEIRNNLDGLVEFGAFRDVGLSVSGRDGARRYSGVAAEPNIFQLTRTEPLMGTGFSEAQSQSGGERVAVIGYDVWQNQFGGTTQIIGEAIRINGDNYRIIGVMPEGYFFPMTAEIWIPLQDNATQLPRGEGDNIYGLAHLNGSVSMNDINRELALIMQRAEDRFPDTNTGISAYVEYIPRAVVGDAIAFVYSLHVIAFLILILASINVGNLLLSRAVERSKESAIRLALGAPRWRLISQMLWESVIICGLGGLIGLLLLAWGLEVTERITATFSVDRPPFWWDFGIDGYTLTLVLIFLLVAIVMTGLLPAWKNANADFNAVLRDGTRGALGKKSGRLNKLLVISEIFVALTVLIAAGVMTVVNFKSVSADYGADTGGIQTAEVLLTESSYASADQKIQFANTLQSRLENTPEIGAVMISSALPGAFSVTPTMAIEGREYTGEGGFPRANYIVVMPGSMQKLGVELREGRYLNNSDDGTDKTTVLVTDSFAQRHFQDESPLGKRLRITEDENQQPIWLTVVGVVEHTAQGATFASVGDIPSVFRPFTQSPRSQFSVAMKVASDSSKTIDALRSTIASIDPDLPAFRIEPYQATIDRNTKPLLFITTVFLLFGIAAVVLASSGIYGVMANTINQRTQEIGVKRALGANEKRITREFLKMGVKQLLWGGIPGLLLGCAMGFGMSQIFPVGDADLLVVAATLIIVVGGTVLLATYLPTRRVLSLEPSEALRYE